MNSLAGRSTQTCFHPFHFFGEEIVENELRQGKAEGPSQLSLQSSSWHNWLLFFKMSVSSKSWLGRQCFFSCKWNWFSHGRYHSNLFCKWSWEWPISIQPFVVFFFLNWERLCLGCARKYDVLIIWRVHVATPIRIFISSIILVCTMNTSIFSNFFLNNLFFSRRQNNEI